MESFIGTASMNRRSFLTKSAIAAGTLAGMSALLDACGGSTTTSSATTTTITVMYSGGPGTLTDAYIQQFEKTHPTIKVKRIDPSPVRLSAMLAAGTPPDVVLVQGVTEMPNILARGLALNLDPYFAKSTVLKASDIAPINDVFRWNGKTVGQGSRYGIAQDWSPDLAFWYNKKVFDQAHIPYPSATEPLSYAELLDLGKRLTVRKNGKIQVYGLDCDWNIHYFNQGQVTQMLAQNGVSLWNSDFTSANFTSPEARKVFQWYVDWAQAHVGPSILDPDASGPFALFPANRVGMLMFGYWFGRTIATDTNGLPDHVGLAPAPLWGSQRISTSVAATGAYIPASSKNPDAAWSLFEYFFGGQPAIDRAKSGSGMQTLTSLDADLPQTLSYQKEAYDSTQNELKSVKVLRFSPYANYNAMETALAKYIEPVMQGQQTLAQGTQALQDAVNLLVQQTKSQIG